MNTNVNLNAAVKMCRFPHDIIMLRGLCPAVGQSLAVLLLSGEENICLFIKNPLSSSSSAVGRPPVV